VVSFADLDLSGAAGAHTLYQRLQLAARSVCKAVEPDFDLEARRRQRECTRNAVAGAVQRVDRAPLTHLHRNEAARTNSLWQ